MKEMSLADWLEERRANALRISATKRGEDRNGWIEDVSYFLRARESVRQLVAASGDEHANVPLRMYIAIKILRAWNSGTAGYDALVVTDINAWIDGGMIGPVPWPDGPFFAQWAMENGFSKVGKYVGFTCSVKMEKLP